ncbi:glycerol-3-phosphate acyltransferase 1, mitochondrial isoform X3 [Bombus affinis]|uniref:glycerol-3-phosphate acyltransferase 1, mitochondrial isoform X2 n=1 Tax=Bombus affinis TaxID=309941 RepID=UPI0021B81AF9|nr:glycerol-3-phosphate acyltransferase 1, mitochondrial isoform X2 [Bombus affinis]XP_050594329.1 glycerol-3-phosphate acyltransferase 1, mitochondrial isoform X3 [Bombus affinis]
MASSMIDIVSTRLQEVYAKWNRRTEIKRNPESDTVRFSTKELRRTGQQMYKKKLQDKEQARKVRESSLFQIKETEPLIPTVTESSLFLHYCCNSCTPSSRNSLVNTVSKQYAPFGTNVLLMESHQSLFHRILPRAIRVCSFKEHDYSRESILESDNLKEATKLVASEIIKDEGCSETVALEKAKERAKTILSQMESKPNNLFIRITSWITYVLLPCFMQSVIILPSQIEMLKKANETGLPVILLPLHRSHMDYSIITFLHVMYGIKCPLIAAGDNLKIPFFGKLLQGLGAFFIKRRIDPVIGRKDILYRAILQTYILQKLKEGHIIEFFLEGTRTRTGKPCMPKGGILSVILDAYMEGIIEDAMIVPVVPNYERLIDGNFVQEHLGQPKRRETFISTMKAMFSTLLTNYGIMKIDICQPFSLKEMLKSFQNQSKLNGVKISPAEKPLKSTVSSSSLYGTDVVAEEYRQLVDSLARHVVYNCSDAMPIMSTNVVAFILLYIFRDGCTLDELVEAFDFIRHQLESHTKNIAFCGENIDIINHALDILGPDLVKLQNQEIIETADSQLTQSNFVTVIRPMSFLPNVIELSYYSNTVVTCFAVDSIVVTALYAIQSQMNDPIALAQNNIIVSQDLLVEKSLKLCDIFKYEFIFCKPCQELERVIIDTVVNLSHKEIIILQEESYLEEELWSKRFAKNFDDSSDEEYLNKNSSKSIRYKLNLISEHAKRVEYLHIMLQPLVDVYTFTILSLKGLVGQSLSEKDLIQKILNDIKANIDHGIIKYSECLSIDSIKNALKLFEKWNILECYPQENVKIFYLKDQYDTDSAVTKIYDIIAAFRWTKNINEKKKDDFE